MGEETRTGGAPRRRAEKPAPGRTRARSHQGRAVPGDDELARAVNEIEGYLLWEAEQDRTRVRAEAFCDTLPWLTASQRREVELRYRHDQHAAARAYLERIAARSTGLRAEYEGVYRALRRRLITVCATAVVTVAFLAAAMALALGGR